MTVHVLRIILGFIYHHPILEIIVFGFSYWFMGVLFMVWHELGHILFANILHVKVKRVGILLKGAYTIRDTGTPLQNLIISTGGPIFNILLMAALYYSHHWFFAAMNLLLAGSNLLPIKGSDGDRILTCLEQIRKEKACRTLNNSSSSTQ